MVDLAAFGETMLRFSPANDERIETAGQYDVHVAGAESNVATAAQRLGLNVTWISKLSDSPISRRITGELRSHGVTCDVIWSDTGRQGTFYFEPGGPPRGSKVIYDRNATAIATAVPSELPIETVERATAFHTTGITPALSETLAKTTASVLSTAARAGTTTSFDLNYRSKLWSPAEAKETVESLFSDVDVLTVAERDARQVLNRSGSGDRIARSLVDEFCFEVAVLTRGSQPAIALADGTLYEQPTFESTDSYPLGTGDSFVGGFLSQYLAGRDVPRSLAYGAATAALKRSIPGDLAVVTPADVEAVIEDGMAAISR